MHKLNFILVVAAVTLCASEWVARPGYADDAPSVRQRTSPRLQGSCLWALCALRRPLSGRMPGRVLLSASLRRLRPVRGCGEPRDTFTGWGPVR